MTNENAETELTVSVFYRTGRAGAQRLAGGGGPFGFDIAVALMVDELIRRLGCDAVAETGCFAGDTTYYLARRYPDLPVYSCDTDGSCAAFTAARLAGCPNAAVTYEDSLAMLGRVASRHARPLAFLDAHWGAQWPLVAELDIVTAAAGVAVVHDFDIGHDRFSYDSYDGVACGPAILTGLAAPPSRYYALDPSVPLPVPCLQTGRRAGVGVVLGRALGIGLEPPSRFLEARSLDTAVTARAR
ncbi:MAG TPA: hypothetical protein VGD91_13935 [Trebonia sp.]